MDPDRGPDGDGGNGHTIREHPLCTFSNDGPISPGMFGTSTRC